MFSPHPTTTNHNPPQLTTTHQCQPKIPGSTRNRSQQSTMPMKQIIRSKRQPQQSNEETQKQKAHK